MHDDITSEESGEQQQQQQQLAVRRAEMEAISDKAMVKKVFDLAWPATVEAILQTTIRMITSALLGHIPGYSALAISAAGLADRVIHLTWGIFAAIGTGSTVMVARSIGAGNREQANRFASQALVLTAILFTVLAAVLLLFPDQLIHMLYNRDNKMDAELIVMANAYLRRIALGVPFMAINQVVSALMRGAGNTKVTLVTNTTANIVNAGLGYVLIYGRFGLPSMGLSGAGTASVISQGTGALIALIIFFYVQKSIRVSRRWFRLKWAPVKDVFVIGVPHAFEMLLMQFGQIALAGLIGSMGAVELAAHTQGITAESISYMPAMGFGIAATTLVGMSIGVGSVRLSQRYIRILVKWNLIITAFTASILIFMPRQVFSLISNNQEVIALGATYLLIMGFCQFPQQLTGVLAGALLGGGDSKATLVNSLIGLWIVRIPLSYLFARAFGWGIVSIWAAMAVDLVVRFILTITRYYKGKWKEAAYRISGA